MIEVKNLSYKYPRGKENAVKDISFKIDKGEIFGFLGPSGAGKSTTQKILIGLLHDYIGDIKVFGNDLKDWGKKYYEKIGVSFELPNHYQKLTAIENLEFFQTLYRGETENPHRLLEMVGLKEDTNTKVANYSKGMKMRLNFIRSLINKPEIIFLDEPTSGMDPVNARKVKDLIVEQKDRGRTIFLTTHNMTIADELCDRVAFIVDGKINLIDSPQRLKIEQGERALSVQYIKNGRTINEDFNLEGLGYNEQFLEIIRKEIIQTVHTKESTLEDIFIRITGRSLQ